MQGRILSRTNLACWACSPVGMAGLSLAMR